MKKITQLRLRLKKIKKMNFNEEKVIIAKHNPNHFYDLFKDKFIYCGIHLSTDGLKENGKPKKKPVFPYQYDKIEKSLIKNWTCKEKLYKPNGIVILNRKSNICSIDVDKPDECHILIDLMQSCSQIHKTKNGFHFIYKKNDLPYQKLCGVVDINTNLFFVPAYTNEFGEVVGNYEIIKNEGLVDMPLKVYVNFEEIIKTKNKGVITKETNIKLERNY